MMFLVLETFVYHFATQESQQGEGYPVVVLFRESTEARSSDPTDEGHDRLEEAKAE